MVVVVCPGPLYRAAPSQHKRMGAMSTKHRENIPTVMQPCIDAHWHARWLAALQLGAVQMVVIDALPSQLCIEPP